MTEKPPSEHIDPSTIDSLSKLLDDLIGYGAIAATTIITMPDGKQIKLTGQ